MALVRIYKKHNTIQKVLCIILKKTIKVVRIVLPNKNRGNSNEKV